MKKLLSLILALMLVVCAVPAMAELSLGAPFNMAVADFQTWFNTFAGVEVNWVEGNGFVTGSAEGFSDVTLVLDGSGKVSYVAVSVTGSMTDTSFANALGQSAANVAMSALMGETSDMNALQQYAATFEADFTQVCSCMVNATNYTLDQMVEGVSSSGTMMGYPACMSYRVNATNMTMEVIFMLCPKGTTF